MSDFRDVMLARQIYNFRRALAGLAGVLRDQGADDPHAVRIHFTTPDGREVYGSLCLGLLPMADLVDAARHRALEIARCQGRPGPVENSIYGLHLLTAVTTDTDDEKRTR